jgi:nucleotide-binding universal stress UspA family protein
MRTVICASDLSVSSDQAVVQAAGYCEQAGTRLLVLHVQPVMPYLLPTSGQEGALLSAAELEAFAAGGRKALEKQVERLGVRCRDLQLEVIAADRPVYAEIVEKAESGAVDLLVVGCWGASGLPRLLLGSVADKVVRHAHCLVLVAKPSPKSGNIVAATDFSPASQVALLSADHEAARRTGSTRVSVLHCLDFPSDVMGFGYAPLVPVPARLSDSRSAVRERAQEQLAAAVREAGLQASLFVDDGPAATGIVRLAESVSAELVVVGTSGRTGLSRVLMGSVAEAVVRGAPCSVLVVRDRLARSTQALHSGRGSIAGFAGQAEARA